MRIEVAERPAELIAYRPQQVGIVQGAGTTVPCVQGDRTLAVHHCATCGCITYWLSPIGAGRMAVGARLIEEWEIQSARVRRFDGAVTWKYLDQRLLP